MKIRFYKTFAKRKNSTKQYTGTYTEYDCVLKQPTSKESLVVQLATNEMGYKYAYCSDLSTGYFVDDVVSVHNGLTEYHLTEDVLGSNKTIIGNTYAHIKYSSSGYDTMINDERIAVSSDINVYGGATSSILSSTGCYVLTVYNNETLSTSTGFGQSYILNASAMAVVRRWLGNTNVYAALSDYFHGKALDGVFECLWVPFDITWFSSVTPTTINIGDRNNASDGFPFGANDDCRRLTSLAIHQNTTTTIGVNRSTPLDFRSVEPYTTGLLYLPGVGTVDLCMRDWVGETSIKIDIVYEAITGNVKYLIRRANGGIVVQECSCNLAVRCPMGQMVHDGTGIINGMFSAIGSAASGDKLGAAVGIGQSILSMFRHGPSITGGIGGSRTALAYPYIEEIEFRHKTADPNGANYIALRGRPNGSSVQISTLSGYIECEGASVDGALSDHERDEINRFLNTGFYYE